MKDQRSNAYIAGIALIAALLMTLALSFAIGKWSFGMASNTFIVKFPNATGISPNSEVKYAGAHAGRVKAVRLIARKDQDEDPRTHLFNCVEVVCEVDKSLELGSDATATIKQDGFGIAAKYVLFMPGPNHDSPLLADQTVLQGQLPYDLSDLIQPAGEALTLTRNLLGELEPALRELTPTMHRIDTLSEQLGPVLNHADKFIVDGDSVVNNFNTPEGRQRLQETMANLAVATANLKVVSSNAKALTATLASKPWRVFWGGPTVSAPTEDAVLQSKKVIRLKPDVEVDAAPVEAPAKKP